MGSRQEQAAQELGNRGVTLDDMKDYFLNVAEPAWLGLPLYPLVPMPQVVPLITLATS